RLRRANSELHDQGAQRGQAEHELDSAERRMARDDTRFCRENFGARHEEQVLADVSSVRGRNRKTRRDQFPRANIAQAHIAGSSGHLSGQRDLGFLARRSGQWSGRRLQTSRRNAFVSLEQESGGTLTRLAGWPNQNVPDSARSAFSKRTCRSFSGW